MQHNANMKGKMSEYEKRKNRHTLTRLIKNFGTQKLLTLISLLLAASVNLVQIAKPYILKMIIDNNLTIGLNDIASIGRYALAYFGVVVLGVVCHYSQTLSLALLGQRVMHNMRTKLFTHIQGMNMQFFDRNSSGSLLTRINSDIESLSELYGSIIITFVKDILLIFSIIATMFALDTTLALYCMTCLPLVGALTFLYRYFARRNFIKLKSQLSKINGFLAENIIGMKLVQIFCREKQKNDEFYKYGKEYYRSGVVEITLNSLTNPLLNALSHVFVAILLSLFSKNVLNSTLDIGVLYAFCQYIKQFFSPVVELAEQFTSIQSAIISADRIYDIIDVTEYAENLNVGKPLKEFSGHIEFDHVWFAYNEDNWVLKDVSFEVLPGQSAAFVGATGSGKTTIISLLARFYEIQKGRILIDGVDIREYNLSDLRKCISVVQQDVFLFTGDINYNIRLNNDYISDDEIKLAAETVSADKFIMSLPEGYRSHVAERGSEFSAGQRQLIAFARAVAAKPSVLILDEATASIDTETEQALGAAMAAISSNHTTLIIAHRLSTIVNCDQIFVLDHGVIIERGKHSELIEKDGYYAELYKMSLTNGGDNVIA